MKRVEVRPKSYGYIGGNSLRSCCFCTWPNIPKNENGQMVIFKSNQYGETYAVTGISGGKRKKTVVKPAKASPMTLTIGPKTGPRLNFLGGAPGRSRTLRPRSRTRRIGVEYEMLRPTTLDERMALRAEELPKN